MAFNDIYIDQLFKCLNILDDLIEHVRVNDFDGETGDELRNISTRWMNEYGNRMYHERVELNMYNYSDSRLIEIAREYSRNHKTFCTDFIDSIECALDEYGELTSGQREALEKIVSKFRMIKN